MHREINLACTQLLGVGQKSLIDKPFSMLIADAEGQALFFGASRTGNLNLLKDYSWPGNVRELERVIERAVIASPGNSLQALERFEAFRNAEEIAGEVSGETSVGPVKALAALERDHILQVLLKTSWRIEGKSGAAVLLGINPSTLRARIRKFGIPRR